MWLSSPHLFCNTSEMAMFPLLYGRWIIWFVCVCVLSDFHYWWKCLICFFLLCECQFPLSVYKMIYLTSALLRLSLIICCSVTCRLTLRLRRKGRTVINGANKEKENTQQTNNKVQWRRKKERWMLDTAGDQNWWLLLREEDQYYLHHKHFHGGFSNNVSSRPAIPSAVILVPSW